MAKRTKTYKIKFSPWVIIQTHKAFYNSLGEDIWREVTNFSIRREDEEITYDSEDEFFAEYEEEIDGAYFSHTCIVKGGQMCTFQVHYYPAYRETHDTTNIDIELGSKSEIDKIFAIFDKNYQKKKPQPISIESTDSPSESDRDRTNSFENPSEIKVFEQDNRTIENVSNVSKTGILKEPFILMADELRKLDKIIQPFGNRIKYTLRCSDNGERSFTDIESLIGYENPPNRKIQSIRIGVYTAGKLRLGAFMMLHSGGISYEINGSEQMVNEFTSSLAEWSLGVKPWYAFIVKHDHIIHVIAYFLLFVLIFMLIPNNLKTSWTSLIIILFAIGIVITKLLDLMIKRPFPKNSFAIGQELKRYENDEKWRWSALVAFFVSVIAGIIVTLYQFLFNLNWSIN